MAMLSRYQKSGGFLQLVKLIETCGKQKQDNFLKLIEDEDPRWSDAVKAKMLSLPKIMSWEQEVLAEIFSRSKDLTLATALHGFTQEEWTKISNTFSHSHKRRIEDLRDEKPANAGEINAAHLNIIEDVRNLISDGFIRVDKFAPELMIIDDIEEKLSKGEFSSAQNKNYEESESEAQSQPSNLNLPKEGSSGSSQQEMQQLFRKMQALHKENQLLKSENKKLKERILSIKKMTA